MYNVDFTTLKVEFSEYLQKLGLIPEADNEKEAVGISIFEYKEEFKDFIYENYDIDMDSEEFSANLSDLMESDIEDGKIVLPQDESENKDMTFIVRLLNGLFEDEEFVKQINDDEIDDSLSDDEIKKFLTFAGALDDDEENLTFDEIIDGFKKVNEGEYKPEDIELEEDEENMKEKEEIETSTPTSSASHSSSGGYSGGGGTSGNSSSSSQNSNNSKKTYEQMNTEELNSEYKAQQVIVNDKAKSVDSVINQNNQDITKAKEEYDAVIKEDENISSELQEKRNKNLDEITQTDSTIAQLNIELNDIDMQIFVCESELSAIESNISGLNASLSTLSAVSGDDVEAQAEVNTKRESINQQLANMQAKQQEVNAKKTQLEEQKTQKQQELDANNEKLNTLNLEKNIIDEEILANANEDTKLALQAYNQARVNADTNFKNAQNVLKTEKEKLGSIEKYLNNSKKEDVIDEYGYSPTADIFKEVNGYNWSTVTGQTALNYGVISPNEIDPNKKMPLLIYLHGTGHERGGLGLMENTVYGEIFKNYKPEDFNGYVLCPNLTSGTWQSEASAQAIEKVIADFAKTHNIDEENIALVGHSFGGSGALYMANSDTFNGSGQYQLKKVAALTGYPARKSDDFKIPVTIYADADSYGILSERAIGALKEADGDQYFDYRNIEHGLVDNLALTADKDGNNRADLFEWLYEE